MQNFPFTHEGKELWYSRSMAASLALFAFDVDENDKLHAYVLANKRGPGVDFNAGKWNMPGGFLDFNETLEQSVIRETYEETGVQLSGANMCKMCLNVLDSEPNSARQTVLINYYAIATDKEAIEAMFSTEHCEPDEVDEIKFIDLEELHDYEWTRNQLDFIHKAMMRIIADVQKSTETGTTNVVTDVTGIPTDAQEIFSVIK